MFSLLQLSTSTKYCPKGKHWGTIYLRYSMNSKYNQPQRTITNIPLSHFSNTILNTKYTIPNEKWVCQIDMISFQCRKNANSNPLLIDLRVLLYSSCPVSFFCHLNGATLGAISRHKHTIHANLPTPRPSQKYANTNTNTITAG